MNHLGVVSAVTETPAIERAVVLFSLDDEPRKRLAVNLRALTMAVCGLFRGLGVGDRRLAHGRALTRRCTVFRVFRPRRHRLWSREIHVGIVVDGLAVVKFPEVVADLAGDAAGTWRRLRQRIGLVHVWNRCEAPKSSSIATL